VTRLSGLFDRGIAPRVTLEAARVEQSAAESLHTQAIAQVETARLDLDRSQVRARFPGVVTHVYRTEGDVVRAEADPVLQVIDPSRYQVVVDLPIAQLARVVPGQTATVRAIGGAADIAGSVALKAPVVDPNAPTGQVRIGLSDTTDLEPQMPVSVEILLDQRSNVLVVPTDALLRDELSAYVVVAGDDRRAHRRDVRAGLATSALVEIVTGLEAGERVIVGGASDLSEGALVSFVD
jgi:RND family efflux transporter MFP subunit